MSGAPAKRRRLDSEDDDDEYVAASSTSPLLQYAVHAHFPTDEVPTLDEAPLHASLSRGSSTAAGEDADEGLAPSPSDAAVRAAAAAGPPVPCKPPQTFEEDEDVPAEYKGLFSSELTNVLLVPLDHVCRQRVCTDKLLAQYAPSTSADAVGGRTTYLNAYGIAPGFRWDGVVRGRGPVS